MVTQIREKGEKFPQHVPLKSSAKCFRAGNEGKWILEPVVKIRVTVINFCYRDLHDGGCRVWMKSADVLGCFAYFLDVCLKIEACCYLELPHDDIGEIRVLQGMEAWNVGKCHA